MITINRRILAITLVVASGCSGAEVILSRVVSVTAGPGSPEATPAPAPSPAPSPSPTPVADGGVGADKPCAVVDAYGNTTYKYATVGFNGAICCDKPSPGATLVKAPGAKLDLKECSPPSPGD